MRDARREAYMDYAIAVHEISRTKDDPGLDQRGASQHMHRALTAISLVGPTKVNKACNHLSPILRATPIDMVELNKGYDAFIASAVVALAPSTWYRVRMRFARPRSDAEYRHEAATLYPNMADDAAPDHPPSSNA
jgi:hypothetical protein